MKVFSKRYGKELHRLRPTPYSDLRARLAMRRLDFLDPNLRIRLSQQISYLIIQGSYVEPFLLKNLQDGSTVFNDVALRKLSFHELGYDLTDYYDPYDLIPIKVDTNEGKTYDDKFLIDLAEIILIFAIDNKREEIKDRFQNIFNEEKSNLCVYGHMIILKDGGGLQSIIQLLNNEMLREKLEDILINRIQSQVAAKESAEVTQFVFSSATKGNTKQDSEAIIKKISDRWVDKKDRDNFQKLLNSIVKNVKELNNEISNIRHTDRSTIDYKSPDIFKMIRNLNLAISELAILSTQDDFIEKENVATIKSTYLKNYNVVNQIMNEDTEDDEPIDLSQIRF